MFALQYNHSGTPGAFRCPVVEESRIGKQTATFNKALGEIAQTLASGLSTRKKLEVIVRVTAASLGARGCSVLLLDKRGKNLSHVASHGLSERYLHKGFPQAGSSLGEISGEKTVTILDASTDPRVQFADFARQEQIVSVTGVPLKSNGEVIGSIRLYSRNPREFSAGESDFLNTVANLASLALATEGLPARSRSAVKEGVARTAPRIVAVRPDRFAHPSEEEFARLLDFYQIDWLYEPRSFSLEWENGTGTETFTPDFYLPGLDLYIEMTTLKPGLAKQKNRRVRRLRELYPDVNIRLLARRDYDRLLAKYGYGPLIGPKTSGVGRILFSTSQIQKRVQELAGAISSDYKGRRPVLVGVLRGVVCFMADLMRDLSIPAEVDFMSISYYHAATGESVRVTKDVDIDLEGRHVLLVEDIVDTGMTLKFVLDHLMTRNPASVEVCTLLDKRIRRLANIPISYVGFEVPDEFLVGYGLDYREEYRNLSFVALLKEDSETEADKIK